MKRKEFLRMSALAAAAIGSPIEIFASGRSHLNWLSFLEPDSQNLAEVSADVEKDFTALVEWMGQTGWLGYLKDATGVNLSLTGTALRTELTKDIDPGLLRALTGNATSGFDDFAGMNMIKVGFPAFSLLYHALASPRVRPASVTAYPDLAHLDSLENYIYAMADFNHIKEVYSVSSNSDLVLAVFAYEYRPAFKTPHHAHADLVYSRTGVARIGSADFHYDPINRCFTNKPKDGTPVQQAAVVPARYGLFLAKRVKHDQIDLMSTGVYKPGDKFDDEEDAMRTFLQPIRKVTMHDALFDNVAISFSETHRSQKLAKIAEHTDIKFYNDLKPTIRESAHLIIQDPQQRIVNSSFLVISKPEPLIRIAKEGDKAMYFLVPPAVKAEGGGGYYRNRYFTSFNTQDVQDVELLVNVEGTQNYQHIPNQYNEPRTQPLFLNITHERATDRKGYKEVTKDNSFDQKMLDGMYQSPLFEDSICEGNVTAAIDVRGLSALPGLSATILPAYSIVTAPDFFPQVDNFDLMAYDVAPGQLTNDTNFYEGGTATLATLRLIPSPHWIPKNDLSDNQTYTAVLSHKLNGSMERGKYDNPSLPKGYMVSGYLPDVASSVFAPGWDITYSADVKGSTDVYLSTEGLGSPFVEDMKLCAAANGMWPASSPDAARTYQGSLDVWSRNPTAIPLMDSEIGFHKASPAVKAGEKVTYGWDGVQGPFLEQVNNKWMVNFADIGRSDVVEHALDGKVDMSKLRELTSSELIARMASLKKVIATLPKTNFKEFVKGPQIVAYTSWWLLSAEPVDFGAADAKGWGVPKTLVGVDAKWITAKANHKVSGKGYLFVIADTAHITNKKVEWVEFSRRRATVPILHIAQVAYNDGNPQIALATIKSGKVKWMEQS